MAAKPSEHKTVQARILAYAQEIGWAYVPRGEAEKRRGFDRSKHTPAEQAAEASPYFNDALDAQVRKLNPKYAEGPGALVGGHVILPAPPGLVLALAVFAGNGTSEMAMLNWASLAVTAVCFLGLSSWLRRRSSRAVGQPR